VELAPPGRFGNARRYLGEYASSGDRGSLKKALGSYSRKGMGGASKVASRMRTSTSAVRDFSISFKGFVTVLTPKSGTG
jgi:hypothetical protein